MSGTFKFLKKTTIAQKAMALLPGNKSSKPEPERDPQLESPLLQLAPELRNLVYSFVFGPPYEVGSAKPLTLIATCRLVYLEARFFAYHTLQFQLKPNFSLRFRLDHLGARKSLDSIRNRLQVINITMKLVNIDATGPNNPFQLMELPLRQLRINFTDEIKDNPHPFWIVEGWNAEVALYYKLISSFLYRSTESHLDPLATPVHRLLHEQRARRIQRQFRMKLWTYLPAPSEVRMIMFRCQAKEVMVCCENAQNDFLFDAFKHFRLMSSRHTWGKMHIESSPREGFVFAREITYLFYDQQGKKLLRMSSALTRRVLPESTGDSDAVQGG